MARQYRSDVMASIHETVENLHAAGTMDKRTLRQFDEACLTPVRSLTATEIRALREREGASQAVFARYLKRHHGAGQPVGRGERSTRKAPRFKLLSLVERGGLTAVA